MKVLNLYAGIGGNRQLWENVDVTAVENNPEIAQIYSDLYPDDEKWDDFGIGYLDSADLCTDAMGFNAIPISNRVIDKDADGKWDVVSWEEIK